MLGAQRQQVIAQALSRSRYIGIADAVALTGASEATIRRDFAHLEAQGVAKRHRGGVELAGEEPIRSLPLAGRIAVRDEAKRLIAEKAALLCRDGETVFLDAGTTALALARVLCRAPLRVVTNSFAAAGVLLEAGAGDVILTGGRIDRESQVVVSYLDDPIVSGYPADIAFLGAQGVDEGGVTNSDERLIRVERSAARNASKTVIVADSSKFGVRGKVRLCGLEEIDTIVTDSGVSPAHRQMIQAAGVELIVV